MSLASKSKSASAAKTKAVAPKEDPKVKALEAKVAELESKLTSLAEALKKLENAPAPVAAGSQDTELRAELKKHFVSIANPKRADYIPNLD